MTAIKNILYVYSEKSSSFYWEKILRKAVSDWGRVFPSNEVNAIRKINIRRFDGIIIDSADVYDIKELTTQIQSKLPDSHIIIVSDVCTWRRAREAFHIGASEYIQKTINHKELRKQLLKVFSSPAPQ